MPDGTFVINALPSAGTTVEVSVVATNVDGVSASGRLSFIVQAPKSGLNQELAKLECRIRHIVDVVKRIPRLPIPEIKVGRKEVLTNIVALAKELSVHASMLEKEARLVTKEKGQKAS